MKSHIEVSIFHSLHIAVFPKFILTSFLCLWQFLLRVFLWFTITFLCVSRSFLSFSFSIRCWFCLFVSFIFLKYFCHSVLLSLSIGWLLIINFRLFNLMLEFLIWTLLNNLSFSLDLFSLFFLFQILWFVVNLCFGLSYFLSILIGSLGLLFSTSSSLWGFLFGDSLLGCFVNLIL